jgi:N utilization substance protein A
VDDKEKVMEVVVEDSQLSLAIGKKGQNVRLAAKLTGWRIDIKSEEEKRKEVELQFGALEAAVADGDVPAESEAPAAEEVPAAEETPAVATAEPASTNEE